MPILKGVTKVSVNKLSHADDSLLLRSFNIRGTPLNIQGAMEVWVGMFILFTRQLDQFVFVVAERRRNILHFVLLQLSWVGPVLFLLVRWAKGFFLRKPPKLHAP